MRITLRLLAFLQPFWGWVALSVFLGVATVASAIGLLGTSAFIIASAAYQPSIAELQVAIVGVRFFGITRGVFRYLERLVSHLVNLRLLAGLRVWLYEKLEPLAPAGLTGYRSGDLLSRAVADVDYLENFYVRAVAPVMVAVIITVGISWFIGMVDPSLGWTLTIGLIVEGVAVPWLSHLLTGGLGKKMIAHRSALSTDMVDGMAGLGELLVFGRGKEQQQLIHRHSQALRDVQLRQGLVAAAFNAVNVFVTNLTLVAILALAFPLIYTGRMDAILLAVVCMLVLASFEAVAPLSAAAQHLEASRQAGRRLFELAERSVPVRPPIVPHLPIGYELEVKGLTFAYPENGFSIQDLEFCLPAGKKIGITGASGSGKTTLANLLMRHWDYQAGNIFLGGVELKDIPLEEIHRTFSLVSSQGFIFSGTVRSNLVLAKPAATEEDLWDALKVAQMVEFVHKLPEGMDTWLGENGLQLSGGERQRLLIARGWLQNCPILILDEPTIHLDRKTEEVINEVLRNMAEGKSVIWISHNLQPLESMDEILVLHEGRIVEHGTHAELLMIGGRYARLWQLQHRMLEG